MDRERDSKGKYVLQEDLAMWERRQKVAHLYISRLPQHVIGTELGISQTTVFRDIEAIKEAWRNSAIIDFNEALQRELAEVETLEREYWEAWRRSKDDLRITEAENWNRAPEQVKEGETSLKRKRGPARRLIRKETTPGDPRFLQGIERCIEMRAKLLGLIVKRVVIDDWRDEARKNGLDPAELEAEVGRAIISVAALSGSMVAGADGSTAKPAG